MKIAPGIKTPKPFGMHFRGKDNNSKGSGHHDEYGLGVNHKHLCPLANIELGFICT